MSDFEQRSLDPVGATAPQTAPGASGGYAPAASLLKRAYLFLEDGEIARADEYFEKVLDLEPENAQAYLGKLLVQLRLRRPEDLHNYPELFNQTPYYQKVMRFADPDLRRMLTDCHNNVCARKYGVALSVLENETNPGALYNAELIFNSLGAYSDAAEKARLCRQRADFYVAEEQYLQAKNAADQAQTSDDYAAVAEMFNELLQHKDSAQLVELYRNCAIETEKEEIYADALKFQREGSYNVAINAFDKILDYKDSEQRKTECQQEIAKEEKLRKKRLKIVGLSCVIAIVLIIAGVLVAKPIKYSKAEKLVESSPAEAAIAFGKMGDYKDARERSFELWDQVARRDTISAGRGHTVALKADGTVVAVGANYNGRCDVAYWTDIVAVSAGTYHTVGLKADGTVVTVGANYNGQCDISEWTDIVAIFAGAHHTVGLKADGTVVAVGWNDDGQCDVSEWTDIVAISAGEEHTVGLKSDGTVVAAGYGGYGLCDVTEWTDIVAISAGLSHTVGLKADGTVVAVGRNNDDQCDVTEWTDIVAISAGYEHTVGLKSDGAVVAVGENDGGQCNFPERTDIVAISTGSSHTVGLKADGTVVAVGRNDDGRCDVSGWTNIKVPQK